MKNPWVSPEMIYNWWIFEFQETGEPICFPEADAADTEKARKARSHRVGAPNMWVPQNL